MIIFEYIRKLKFRDTETITPHHFADEMLNQLPLEIWSNPDARFIDMAGGTGTFVLSIVFRLNEGLRAIIPNDGERLKHIMMHQVYYNDISPDQVEHYQAALRKLGIEQWAKNVYNFDALTKEWNMKFDVVVGNPPYKAGLHLDFLQQAHEITKDDGCYIIVHPAEWLVQKRVDPSPKRKKYASIKSTLSHYYVETKFINNPFGESAKMFVPMVITFGNKSKIGCKHTDSRNQIYGDKSFVPSQHSISSLDDVSQWFNGNLDNSIIQKFKIASDKESWKKHLCKKKGNFYMALSRLAGGGYTNLVYTNGKKYRISNMYSLGNIFTLEYCKEVPVARAWGDKEEGNIKPWVSFATENEFNNALSFLMRNRLVRAYIALIKIDQHACDALLHLLPWLDWSEEWTEQALAEHIGLDELEVNNLLMIFDAISEK